MKVAFRCKASGNTCSFTNEHDIEHMRKESHYEEVKDELQIKEQNANEDAKEDAGYAEQESEKKVKTRGRPKMVI